MFITTLILVVLTSHAFAKFYRAYELGSEIVRPAIFEFVATGSEDRTIFVDFGDNAETAPVYGTRTVSRTYDFAVRMDQSEVASIFTIELYFPSNLYKKISQTDKGQPGVWVNFRVYAVNDLGLESENLLELTDSGVTASKSDGSGTWTYSELVPVGANPQGKVGFSDFRLEFIVLNVEDTSNVVDAAIYTTNLGLNLSATQID